MKRVFEAALEEWGLVPQMLMVAEEAVELAHAVLKWRRAHAKWETFPPAERMDQYREYLEAYAALSKAGRKVIDEASDVRLMLDQLEILLPGNYEGAYEEKLQACIDKLRSKGVEL